MSEVVLDASAFLAVVFQEHGAETVLDHLPGATMSSVNAAEVVGKMLAQGEPEPVAVSSFRLFGVAVIGFELDDAVGAGKIHAETRGRGLSLGDCACLALGQNQNARVLTADRAWSALALDVEIEMIR